jgi:hypothetical protein
MRTSPLRVAVWCVVILTGIVLIRELRRDVDGPGAVPPAFVVRGELPSPVFPPPEPVPLPVAKPEWYVGNTNTHKFHRSTCRYAGCKNCTARYATREEAVAAGFRPCGICDP